MKFAKQLQLKLNSEWEKYYLDYKHLKKEVKSLSELQDITDEIQIEFHNLILRDLEKLQQFYVLNYQNAIEKKNEISLKWSQINEENVCTYSIEINILCTLLEEIKTFILLNETAFSKILKKFDKKCLKKKRSISNDLLPKVNEFCSNAINQITILWNEIKNIHFQRLPAYSGINTKIESILITPCPSVEMLDLSTFPVGISRVYVVMADDGLSQPLQVPVIVAKGRKMGPILGITSALHGNELNGIPLIHRLVREIKIEELSGIVVAVPVVNTPGYLRAQRGFTDNSDLNRLMPGKPQGTASQQFCYNLMNKIIKKMEYLIDMHTASVGRVNSLYVRANLRHPITRRMALLQNPQIIVHNTGPDGTLRSAAMDCKINAITVEIGDPQRFQKRFVKSALLGVENIMFSLNMIAGDTEKPEDEPIICTNSYWIFSDKGGILTVMPETNTWVRKGEVIAQIHSVFGDLVREYYAPEDSIVIGKSVNPMCNTGDRVIHLGFVTDSFPQEANDGHL